MPETVRRTADRGATSIGAMGASEADTAAPFDEHVLFSVSAWTASVPPDTWWIAPMVADVLEGIHSDPMDAVGLSALRTQPNLQTRREPHWLEFFAFVSRTFNAVLATAGEHRYPAYGMRSWGVLIDSETSKKDLHHGPTRICETHNHSPATFTSVFACELPDYPAAADLSTVFHNPARHMICPWQPRVVLFPPKVGQLLVFPGWIEHSAPVVQPVAEGQRRVIVSTDYFPDQTNAAFDPAR